MNTPNQLSEQLLLAIKQEVPFEQYVTVLAGLNLATLQETLEDDAHKKAFWINIYNAYFLILRKHQSIDRKVIFTQKLFTIAGNSLSLDDVEHGILRRYRYKFSLGYLPNIFAPNLIKQLAINQIDYRIHFALNCGAASCPPIAFYQPAKIDQQLEMATLSFLEGETKVIADKKEIHISQLFKWYQGDFGGPGGIRKILQQKLGIVTKESSIIYLPYSWEEELDNYLEESFNS